MSPKDYKALSGGIEKLLTMDKIGLKQRLRKARQRIVKNFSIEYAESQYLGMYEKCMK